MYKFSQIMWTRPGLSRTLTDVALSLCYEDQTITSHFIVEEIGRGPMGTATHTGLEPELGLSQGHCLEIFFPSTAALHVTNFQ